MAQGNEITRFIYRNSPHIFKNILASCYGFSRSLQKYGRQYKEFYEYLNRSQWLTSDALKSLQVRELKRIITYAVSNVPYYTDLFKRLKLSLDDINSKMDLTKLPILTKEGVRLNFERLISKNYNRKYIIINHTSGTTGKSLKLAISKARQQKEQAFIWLHRSWGGVKFKDKTATFAGHMVVDINQKKPPFWVNNFYDNQVIFSSYHLTKSNLKYYAEKLVKFRPQLIWGYPSSIYTMALFMEKEKITGLRLKAIFTGSETLFNYQREKIEKVFNAKVFNWYGNAELVANITECEKGNLHINPEYSAIEFLNENDEPVESGQIGRMVCTGFGNYAMPLIRYDVGDLAIPIEGNCSCRRNSPLVKEISGRTDDVINTPDGRHIGRLSPIFHNTENIEEAQLIQNNNDSLLIKVVRRPNYSEIDARNLLRRTRERLGDKMKIQIDYIDRIPRLPNGKFKFVISNVPFDFC